MPPATAAIMPTTAAAASPAAAKPSAAYVCPMHPEVTAAGPGRCPTCEMKLVKNEKARRPPSAPHDGHDAHGDGHAGHATPATAAATKRGESAAAFVCPMDPKVTSPVPAAVPSAR